MLKKTILALALCWPIAAQAMDAGFTLPENFHSGKRARISISCGESLPAASFYRVEIECPQRPAGAKVETLAGYPDSDITFSAPGRYECEIEVGIITKTSCAGVNYRKLARRQFTAEVER